MMLPDAPLADEAEHTIWGIQRRFRPNMDVRAAAIRSETRDGSLSTKGVRAGWPDWLWLLVCIAASTIWCVTASPRLGPTFDEPNYVVNGLERWRSGSYSQLMRQGTMPLPVDVMSWPLSVWEQFRGERFRVGLDEANYPTVLDDLALLLPVARLGTLPFWWLLLFYAWRIGRSAGPWGGRLAVALAASEPNLLAHATLATTDIAASACLLTLVFHYVDGRDGDWRRRVLVPGMLFGIALLAKASALVFWPLCWLGIELYRFRQSRSSDAEPLFRSVSAYLRAAFRDGRQIAVIGLAVAFLYVGTEFRPENSFVAWSHSLPEGALRSWMTLIADNLRIFPNAGEGLVYQIKHNIRGHGVYVLGQTHHRALWYYFPLALGIKLSLVSLFLLPASALLCKRALGHWVLAAAGMLLLFSVTYRVQIGIRLVLPLVALLVIGGAIAVTRAWMMCPTVPRRLCAGLALTAVVWGGWTARGAWPHALAYTNEVFNRDWDGGPALCDSNVDWGQGLVELDDWRRQRGLPSIDVWYFGTDPSLQRPPFRPVPLHVLDAATPGQLQSHVDGSLLAVSTTLLYGPGLTPQQQQAAQVLRRMEPVDRTTTFFVFDLSSVGSDFEMAAEQRPGAMR